MIAAGTTAADVVDFFMALLSFRWIQHPEPTGSRRATPTSHFQQRSGHPLEKGQVRVGTFQDFRSREEDHLRDEGEGAGILHVKGQDISLDNIGPHFQGPNFNDVTLRFEAGAGTLSGDMSLNCLCYCASYVVELGDIEPLQKERFPDKGAHFFVANEGLFELRCGQEILRQIKLNSPNAPVYVYCFAGRVTYVDSQKETTLHYDSGGANKPVMVNLAYFFEKPTKFARDQEFRFLWICTNKPIESADYSSYSIVNDQVILDIDPSDCLVSDPTEFTRSSKTIFVWDLPRFAG